MKNYPYLGRFTSGDKHYVVLFVEHEKGVVVSSNIDSVPFGTVGSFVEEKFSLLPPDECVRLSN